MTQAQVLPSYDRPEWGTLAEDVHCPLCAYNLRGLSEPRCPECGYQFQWRDLLDPARRKHPYLFEHHPDHNLRSFLATVTRKFRPFTFWTSLRPDQPADLRRLIHYGVLVSLVTLLPAMEVWAISLNRWWSASVAPFRTAWNDPSVGGVTVAAVAAAAWPLLTFLSLLIFRQSMRHANVLPEHVLRCAIYGGDIVFWSGIAAAALILWSSSSGPGRQAELTALLLGAVYLATFLLQVSRLVAAYRHYMRFHAPISTVLASQLIEVLFCFTLLAVIATN